jgi:hypothetical protein
MDFKLRHYRASRMFASSTAEIKGCLDKLGTTAGTGGGRDGARSSKSFVSFVVKMAVSYTAAATRSPTSFVP